MADRERRKPPRGAASGGPSGLRGAYQRLRASEAARRWAPRLLRVGAVGAIGSAVVGVAGVVSLALLYHHHVISDPGPQLEREQIRAIIAQESPVYYRDGTTRIGVFFDGEHRQYVDWDDLPRAWVLGIVAAEDSRFWAHPGVSISGLVRAVRDNVSAGRLVAGGSTLTQQTAKNLYYRPDRSLRSKGLELLNAMRLEAHYDKHEILTFYANQFHVTGNGRGLAIGARHFFDKEVTELSLLEAAFLAGLVKAPGWYDPFLGDADRRARAVSRAHDRTRYVLGRMVAGDPEVLAGPRPRRSDPAEVAAWEARVAETRRLQAEAARHLEDGFSLAFRRGTFRYDSSAILDEVARRLAEPPFDAVLEAAGVDDPATAGLQVITTLDADAQRSAIYGLWHHLTEVGTWLEALGPEAFVHPGHRGPGWDPGMPLRRHDFSWARVTSVLGDKRRYLEVDLGGRPCVVDRDAIVRVAVASVRGQKQDRNAKAPTEAVDAFVDALPVGSVVLVSVRDVPEEGAPLCDLEVRPTLQGAVTVLEQGQIRAMVGGNDNRNFNRATALRQMGSTWKPVVFHAALQLGWRPDDLLDNRRHVFPFSTTFYYPRPDHEPTPEVSMSWAGVHSENLASVWLLYHLTDRLDPDGVKALAESLDLARRPDESEPDYRLRIQKAGVLPTRGRLVEGQFLQARQEVLAGLDQGRHPEDRLVLSSLLYGWGYDAERARVAKEGPQTRRWKERALANTWRHLEPRIEDCALQHAVLVAALEGGYAPAERAVPDLSVLLDGERVRVACGTIPEGYVRPDEEAVATLLGRPDEDDEEEVDEEAETAEISFRRRFAFGRRDPEAAPARPFGRRAPAVKVVDVEDVRVDDRLHIGTLRQVRDAMRRRQLALELADEPPDLYDPEVLYWHQDFRVLLSLRYVSAMAERYGVQTGLAQVLSLPLGASEITLEEATAVYGGLVSGATWTFPGRAGSLAVPTPPASTLLIAEIRDVDGRVLYRARPEEVRVASREAGHMTADILRNVVRFGTGRRALDAPLAGGTVPLGGKTGTTNDFRNAAFVGYAPVWSGSGFQVDGGFAVGAYVGYDDNRPMTNGRIRLAGASGALPAWLATIQGMTEAGLLGAPEGDPLEDRSWALEWAPGLVRVAVTDEAAGIPVAALDEDEELFGPGVPVQAASVLVPRRPVQDVDFRKVDRPARIAPRTEDGPEEPRTQPPRIWRRPPRGP